MHEVPQIMAINYPKIRKELQENHYANIPIPLTQKIIEEGMQSFLAFLKEPDEIKNHINFSISPLHRRGDVGFKHREPKDGPYRDSKSFFHYHPLLIEKYEDFLKDNPIVLNFVEKAQPIWELVSTTMKDILKSFESEFPGTYDKVFATQHPHILLRFLKYNWQESSQYLAKPHYDAGSFTLGLAESEAGLRIGSKPEDLKPINHKKGNGIFMLSSNYKKVLNTNEFLPGWHDVVQLEKEKIGRPYARWAIVGFIEAIDVEAYSREETHKYDAEAA